MSTHVETCGSCGAVGPHPVIEMTEGKHHAKVHCGECNRFLRWLPKPESEKAKRPAAHRSLVQKFSRGYCELCTIRQDQLPKGEDLEAHHVDEFHTGGEPTRENIWILCTACHTLVNWRRTYVGHFLKQLASSLTAWRQP